MTADLAITREQIFAHAQTLPAAPQVLGGLCELLEDVNTGLDQIAEGIRMDPALAVRVVRISNSVVFGGGGNVCSIDEAVTRMGFAEILRVVGVATVAGLVDRSLQVYGVEAERLRESLLLHALASEALARRAALDPRTAYTAGLLRGVGMMVIDRAARGKLEVTDNFDPGSFSTYEAWERLRFGITGAEVGATLLDGWRFPPEMVTAIERHHAPSDDPLANVLNLAGCIVAERSLALAGEEVCWAFSTDRLGAVGLDSAGWQELCGQVFHTFEQQRAGLY